MHKVKNLSRTSLLNKTTTTISTINSSSLYTSFPTFKTVFQLLLCL